MLGSYICIMVRIFGNMNESFKPVRVNPPKFKIWFGLRRLIDLQLDTIAEHLIPSMQTLSGRVLDVGAGQSPWRPFLPARCHYYGLDLDTACDYGMEEHQPNITYYRGGRMPYADNSFNGAICIEVLEHAKSPMLLLNEIHRVLAPDGILLLSVAWSARRHHIPYDYQRFSPEKLYEMFSLAGFDAIEVIERGTDIHAIANKLTVLNIRALRSLMALPVGVLLIPITAAFICASHASNFFNFGGSEDPLGYFVTATKMKGY
jgi:SAM-dependent methyltransferase